VYLHNPGNLSPPVMSSSKETQEEIAASLKTNTTPIYPSPPDSPPRTKPNSSKARREFEDELRSSGTVSSVLLTPTSPHRNASKLAPKEERPAENKSQMNASTLETLLGLDDRRCRCLTLKKEPCRNWILERNRDQVNSQIEEPESSTKRTINKILTLISERHQRSLKET